MIVVAIYLEMNGIWADIFILDLHEHLAQGMKVLFGHTGSRGGLQHGKQEILGIENFDPMVIEFLRTKHNGCRIQDACGQEDALSFE